jgi:hypothetical protein
VKEGGYRKKRCNVMPKKQPTSKRITSHVPDIDRMVRDLREQFKALSTDELSQADKRLESAFPGGFNERDEANALIAMAVRNGPIENLHAGKHSALLEDDSLSRFTDEEMKTLMIHATRMLAGLLRIKHDDPELYRHWMKTYGMLYCGTWEREQ